jgi:ABC-type nitrate/sulfonate/bicarbonate transport system substrate-binding protein
MMRIPSKWIVAAGVAVAVLTSANSSHAQQTIRVGWTIPAEESKYWMMRRPAEFPDLGKTYNIEWTQFQGTAPMTQALAAGALDCATQAPLSLANGVVGGNLKAYIVAQHVFEKPGGFSVYWAVKDDSPIKTIADLKDLRSIRDALEKERRRPGERHQAGRGRLRRLRGRTASGAGRCREHEPAFRGAR